MTVIIYFREELGRYIVEVRDGKGNVRGGNVFVWNDVRRDGLKYEIELASPARYSAAMRLACNSLSGKEKQK